MADKPLILIADDEPNFLLMYTTKLEKNGYRVITAPDGAEAVKLAAAEHPDLILLDVKMPVMDGAQAEQKLKDAPETKGIKVVFLTAFGDPLREDIDLKMAKQSGAFDFIKKDINLDEFVVKVRGYLGKRSS